MTAFKVAMAFVDAINSKDVDKLANLMTDDHRFIDGDGSMYQGKERMKTGWKEHFELIPDLNISVSDHFEENGTVVLLGWSSGTIIQDGQLKPENAWKVPSAWRVIIESEKVAVWQLHANQHVLLEIYNELKKTEMCLKIYII